MPAVEGCEAVRSSRRQQFVVAARPPSMKSLRKPAVVLVALLALGGTPAAHGAVDYSKNSATGDYAQPVTHEPPALSPASDPAFAWGDAAVGAGVALCLVLLAGVLRSAVGSTRARSGRELAASPERDPHLERAR
jgi:hypothetical protein